MAVEASKVKARLRALFPKANLSTKRLDEISDKLGKKVEDNATDAQIDEALEEYNGIYSFEDIAKNDDRLRTDRKKDVPKKDEDYHDAKAEDDMPAWAKSLMDTVNGFKEERKAQTLEQRFRSDIRLKNVNPLLFTGRIPKTEEDFENSVDSLVKDATELKLNNYGGDTPAGGTGSPTSEVKEKTAQETKLLADSI